jgi:GNAT superfamily N-acetyltransferase
MVNRGNIIIECADPESAAGLALMSALTAELANLYGDDGGILAFSPADVRSPRSVFLVAKNQAGPVGCGALRPLTEEVAEVKRMYVAPAARGQGIGRLLLHELEGYARRFNYASIKLETGVLQPEAIRLYERSGYVRCACYGFYATDPRSVCFEKVLI